MFVLIQDEVTDRHHFVDFLFHRNLTERSIFLALLMAFKRGDGFDDKFFTMFLNEAIQMDKPRVAVDVINTVLFMENGEPSVHALKFCPKIPMTLFQALHKGVASMQSLSDEIRLLLEISMGFEYFALRTELAYLKTLSRAFSNDERLYREQFNHLIDKTNFLSFMISVTNHNVALRENSVAAAAGSGGTPFTRPTTPLGSGKGLNLQASTSADFDDHTITTNSADEDLYSGAGAAVSNSSLAPTRAHPHAFTSAVVAATSTASTSGAGVSMHSPTLLNAKFGRRGSLTHAQAAGACEYYARWMDRSDSNLMAMVYGFVTLAIACGELPEEEQLDVVENVTVKTYLEAQKPSFFTVLLGPGTHLRARLVSFLKTKFSVLSLYDGLLGELGILKSILLWLMIFLLFL